MKRLQVTMLVILAIGTVCGQNLDLATLPSAAGCRYIGGKINSYQGNIVSPAGDFNGDGYEDFIAGASFTQNGTYAEAGAAYVSFGKPGSYADINYAVFDTDNAGGFRISISQASAHLGFSVSSIGDFNGDGLDDVVVGSESNVGRAWVIYGKSSGHANIDVASFSSSNVNGFRIDGVINADWTGRTVAGAGDVNGDGLGDIIVTAAGTASVYLIFGRSTASANIALAGFAASDTNGYQITGYGELGKSAASAGDFNNDGYADIILGGDSITPLLIYGKPTGFQNLTIGSTTVHPDLLRFDKTGVSNSVGNPTTGLESPISSAGDFNGDGYSDVAIGSSSGKNSNGEVSGSAYVVWGRSGTTSSIALLNVKTSSTEGFRIDGLVNSFFGVPLSAAGDVNNDGFDDLLATTPYVSAIGRSSAGTTYLFYGKANVSNDINLASNYHPGIDGYIINGAAPYPSGKPVPAPAGDVNNDGYDDFLINQGKYIEPIPTGITYLVFGGPTLAAIADWQNW